jgi:hypothetical protein
VVLSQTWTKKDACRQALRLLEPPAEWRAIVLFGSKAKTAFGYERPLFSHGASELNPDVQLVCLPGLEDRAWRDPRLVLRAHQLLREIIPSLPWGSLHDPFTTLGFSLRVAAECACWSLPIPAALREKARWTDEEFMVALDAVEGQGLDRMRGEYIARAREALGGSS